MVAQSIHWIKRQFLLALILLLVSCNEETVLPPEPMAFPVAEQQDLIVLVQQGPLTYTNTNSNQSGLEHDLIEAFAQELGVKIQYVPLSPTEMKSRLLENNYHLAAAWFSPKTGSKIFASEPIFETSDLLIQHEASLPLTEKSQLEGKTVHVMAESRQAEVMHNLASKIKNLTVVEVQEGDILDLLESLGKRQIEYVAIDELFEDIANQYVPNLRSSLSLSEEHGIVWLLGSNPNPALAARLNAFIERIQQDGTIDLVEERYLGHIQRLTQADLTKFLAEIKTTLPKLRSMFHAAETVTGIDWRLIAAVAYQESHWDPLATSPTNVRGIMMLTEETADRLGVSNRLDAYQSILAGARYINMLKDMQYPEVPEPDRTWLALAAYNIGPGHFNAARTIAKQLDVESSAWYEMKKVLPLLAKPQYYQRLKSGRARGGEAVILVENIRNFYDILVRNEPPLSPPTARMEGMIGMQGDKAVPKLKL